MKLNIFHRHQLAPIRLLQLSAIVLFATGLSLNAETCQTMLKPYFDWANQLHPVRTPGYSDDRFPVNVTFTKHLAGGKFPDPVQYAQGELDLTVRWLLNSLASKIVQPL